MSPVRTNPYPNYNVEKIVQAFRNPTPDLVNVYAHRALRLVDGSTENSLSSIAAAARAGYEGIEIDVRLTRDRQVVIFHDEGLGRSLDLGVPEGQIAFNPFTGKGYSPLVKETMWFGMMEKSHLKDVHGNTTSERPIRLEDLLSFICDEGINILVQLDIKDLEAMSLAYEIVRRFENAKGVPALEWCVWKCIASCFPSPITWESQDWVKAAVKAGRQVHYISLYNDDLPKDFPLMESVRAWATRKDLLHFEIQMQRRGGWLQEALDFVQSTECAKSVCTWRISGDLPESYHEVDSITWDDAKFRQDILACGQDVPIQFDEWRGVKAVGAVMGRGPTEHDFDGRTSLPFLLDMGFTSLVADTIGDLDVQLRKRGKRNTSRMV